MNRLLMALGVAALLALAVFAGVGLYSFHAATVRDLTAENDRARAEVRNLQESVALQVRLREAARHLAKASTDAKNGALLAYARKLVKEGGPVLSGVPDSEPPVGGARHPRSICTINLPVDTVRLVQDSEQVFLMDAGC